MREALKLALEALRDIIEGSRLDVAGNRNDDGLIDHDGVHNFKLRISAAHTAIEAVKEALAQPEQKQTGIREIRVTETVKQKPVAWMTFTDYGDEDDIWYENPEGKLIEGWTYKPLYTTPQPAQDEALEPLEYWNAVEGWVKIDEVRKHFDSVGCGTIYKTAGEDRTPLYTTSPKREWVGLTEAEREEIENRPFSYNDWLWFYTHAVEAKLKEKNT